MSRLLLSRPLPSKLLLVETANDTFVQTEYCNSRTVSTVFCVSADLRRHEQACSMRMRLSQEARREQHRKEIAGIARIRE
jgi:hypothetical protein